MGAMQESVRKAGLAPDSANQSKQKMEPCLGGCGKLINPQMPWGRWGTGGVCGAICNEAYRKKRTTEQMLLSS